jgi:plastocyanin
MIMRRTSTYFGSALLMSAAVLLAAAAIPPALADEAQRGATVAASTPSVQASLDRAEIAIDNFTFGPAELTVTVGTTVTWVNKDDIPHLVVEKSGAFRSKALDTNDRFSLTFNQVGVIEYFCGLHPHMTGKIIVKAA